MTILNLGTVITLLVIGFLGGMACMARFSRNWHDLAGGEYDAVTPAAAKALAEALQGGEQKIIGRFEDPGVHAWYFLTGNTIIRWDQRTTPAPTVPHNLYVAVLTVVSDDPHAKATQIRDDLRAAGFRASDLKISSTGLFPSGSSYELVSTACPCIIIRVRRHKQQIPLLTRFRPLNP